MRPIGMVAPVTWIFFTTFMIVVTIGMLELLTAIFVDTLTVERRKEANLQLEAEREAYKLASDLIEDMLEVFDTDGNGTLDSEELELIYSKLKEKGTQNMLKAMDVQPESLKKALKIADIMGSGYVSRRSFARAWSSMHEDVKESDIRGLHKHVNIVEKKIDAIVDHLGIQDKTAHLVLGLGLSVEEDDDENDPLAWGDATEGDEDGAEDEFAKLRDLQARREADPMRELKSN